MKTTHDPRYERLVSQLKDARLSAGLTQRQVANALGWRRNMISYIETGQRRVDILELLVLARLYGITMHRLIGLLEAGSFTAPL